MTGHKSIQSLTVYQRVQNNKRMEMGKVLGSSLTTTDENLMKQIMPAPPRRHTVTMMTTPLVTSPQKAIEAPIQGGQLMKNTGNKNNILVPYEPNFDDDIDDTDWLKILCEVEDQNKHMLPMPTSETQHNDANAIPPCSAIAKLGTLI